MPLVSCLAHFPSSSGTPSAFSSESASAKSSHHLICTYASWRILPSHYGALFSALAFMEMWFFICAQIKVIFNPLIIKLL